MGFMDDYGALMGAGVGLLPSLLRAFNPSSSGSNTAIPNMAQTAALFPGVQASDLQAYANANPGIASQMNQQGQFLNAPGAAPATANADANSNPMSSLAGIGNALSPQHTTSPGGSTPVQPATPQPPNYAGTGPNAAMMAQQVLSGQGAGQGQGANAAPLGPAANNPLLAMLRARLGVMA